MCIDHIHLSFNWAFELVMSFSSEVRLTSGPLSASRLLGHCSLLLNESIVDCLMRKTSILRR